MTRAITFLAALLGAMFLTACAGKPDAPVLTLTSVEGSVIELNTETPLTALFFFSISNPVALGEFDRLPDRLHEAAEQVAVAMHVDRPPNVMDMQQRTLVPIVIDSDGQVAAAFGDVGLTPAIFLVKRGKILLHQQGQLDYDALNALIVTEQ